MNPPLPQRLLRAVVLLALCAVVSLLAGLAAVGLLNPFTEDDQHFRRVVWAMLLVVLGLPTLIIWLAFRLRLRSWWWLGGGWLAVLPVLVYLAVDDPVVRRPITFAELAPAFPGAEQSYAVLMRFAVGTAATKAFKLAAFAPPKEADQLSAYALEKRERIERTWEELASVRQWYGELSAFDRIGDLGNETGTTPAPAYAPHRVLAQTAQLKALLLALDGRGDDAIALLLPVLDVGWKLQVNSRSVARLQIGFTVRRMALEAAEFTLARTPVSPALRNRLAAVLGPTGGAAGARRLIAIEYVFWAAGSMNSTLQPSGTVPTVVRYPLRVVQVLIYNPNRTINEVGDVMAEFQDLAARRRTLRPLQEGVRGSGILRMKNLGGQIAIHSGMPSYQSVLDSYWRTEDRLAAVRARLAQL
ncbi:MAG: hypothetical protein B9S34_15165 [Opitutia bacterium Tous-C1TDCM]|nr:MAG: hypothetical protein B9S34_15165 [Opitutae bacterium Tous-C1TDCM]